MGLWSRLFGARNTPRDLLADLAGAYRAELQQATQLSAQAERARYPQAAEALRRLAEVETRHATWLRDQLVTRGGPVPAVEPGQVTGNNQWERAVAALQTAHAKRRRLIELITHWDPEEPEVVALLHRIEEEDQREHAVYEGIIMRSDPQSLD
jgi:rubrerythrin